MSGEGVLSQERMGVDARGIRRKRLHAQTRAAVGAMLRAVARRGTHWAAELRAHVEILDDVAIEAQRDGYLELVFRIERAAKEAEFGSKLQQVVAADVVEAAGWSLLRAIDGFERVATPTDDEAGRPLRP